MSREPEDLQAEESGPQANDDPLEDLVRVGCWIFLTLPLLFTLAGGVALIVAVLRLAPGMIRFIAGCIQLMGAAGVWLVAGIAAILLVVAFVIIRDRERHPFAPYGDEDDPSTYRSRPNMWWNGT